MIEAKKLFEELGYCIQDNDEYCICYTNKKEDIDFLQAINQQCKELEWFLYD